MKEIEHNKIHFVVENLNTIMNDRKLSQKDFAELIGFANSKWNKISTGCQQLNMPDFSIIAKRLNMQEIDILTYHENHEKLNKSNICHEDIKTQIVIELSADLKDLVLQKVFQNQNLKIVNA